METIINHHYIDVVYLVGHDITNYSILVTTCDLQRNVVLLAK